MKFFSKICWITLCIVALGSGLSAQGLNHSAMESAQLFRLPSALTDLHQIEPTLSDSIAWFIQATLEQMGRPDVLVGIAVDRDSTSLSRWRTLIPTGEILDLYSEALILTDVTLTRESAEAYASERYFESGRRKQKQVMHPIERTKNVRTEIAVVIEYLATTSGASLGSSIVRGVSENGSQTRSRYKADTQLNKQLILELERIYGISADLAFDQKKTIEVNLGKNNGVFKNMCFSLISPELSQTGLQGEKWQPSGPSGCGKITASGDSMSRLKIYRQWRVLPTGSYAIPCQQPVFSFFLHIQPPVFNSYGQYGLYLQGNPLAAWDWGIGMNLIRLKDSRGDEDLGFGAGIFTRFRLWCSRRIDTGIKFGGDLDIPMRNDAYGSSVNTLLLSMHTAVTAEMVMSYRVNLVTGAGYRFSKKNDSWNYANDNLNFIESWNGEAPTVSNHGLFLSVGFRYCLF